MDKNQIIEGVKKAILKQAGIDFKIEDITAEKNLTKDLALESLDMVELVQDLEREYKITIWDTEAEKVSTVQDAINLVTEKVEVKNMPGLFSLRKEKEKPKAAPKPLKNVAKRKDFFPKR